jgi:membrane protein
MDEAVRARGSGHSGSDSSRGRQAASPPEVPKVGWLDIFWRMKRQLNEDNLPIVSAGVAFYAFVAVVPALAATIAIYALVLDPAQLAQHLELLAQVVPAEVMPLLREQMTRIAEDNQAAGISAIMGVAVALYGSAKATKALIMGLNIAYDETEKRGFFRLNAVALGITLAGIAGVIVAVTLVTAAPALLRALGRSDAAQGALSFLRWPLLAALFMTALAFLYRFAPSRESPQWRWLSGGAAIASILWVIGSGAFSYYVSQFGNYEKTYGSLGAVVVFLLWLFLTAFVILLGAELNTEMERQTVRDTTSGEPKAAGSRGAYAADTVGPERSRRSKTRDAPTGRSQDVRSP